MNLRPGRPAREEVVPLVGLKGGGSAGAAWVGDRAQALLSALPEVDVQTLFTVDDRGPGVRLSSDTTFPREHTVTS